MVLRRKLVRGVSPRSTHTEWWWPPPPTIYRTVPAGYRDFQQTVRLEVDPGPGGAYLLTYEFKFVGGEGGYIGLQTSGGAEGTAAVFAIYDRPAGRDLAPAGQVALPGGLGRAYCLRVWTDDAGRWSGSVRDEYSGREAVIGGMVVPPTWRRLASWSMTSIEYRGAPLTRCADLRPVQATFSVPTADDATVEPQLHQSRVGDGSCEGAKIEDVSGGVRHAMGLLS